MIVFSGRVPEHSTGVASHYPPRFHPQLQEEAFMVVGLLSLRFHKRYCLLKDIA
jgi:hypothetical protein